MLLKTKFQDENFDLGEAVEANIYYSGDDKYKIMTRTTKDKINTFYFKTLKELNEMFEDYEGPKEYWFVNDIGEVEAIEEDGSEEIEDAKQIGNYFEAKEEAEKAVEKLKAWKRLKDKGFKFAYCEEVEGYDDMIRIMAYPGDCDMEDVKELFGGEE